MNVSLAAAPFPSVTITVTATGWGVAGQKNLVWLAVASANVPTGALQRKVSSSLSACDVVALTCALSSGAAGSRAVMVGAERWLPAGMSAEMTTGAGAAARADGLASPETLRLGVRAPSCDCLPAARARTC